MRAPLHLTVALLFSISGLAQGTINFNTRFAAAGVDAPVRSYYGDYGPPPGYSAALFLSDCIPVFASRMCMLPGSLTTFRDGSIHPSLAQYIEPVVVENWVAAPGSSIKLFMGVWRSSVGDFGDDPYRGRSEDFWVENIGSAITPPVDLPASFKGFRMRFAGEGAEPSILALGVFGGLILWGLGRRMGTKGG